MSAYSATIKNSEVIKTENTDITFYGNAETILDSDYNQKAITKITHDKKGTLEILSKKNDKEMEEKKESSSNTGLYKQARKTDTRLSQDAMVKALLDFYLLINQAQYKPGISDAQYVQTKAAIVQELIKITQPKYHHNRLSSDEKIIKELNKAEQKKEQTIKKKKKN